MCFVFENAGSAKKWRSMKRGIQDDVGREILQGPGVLVEVCPRSRIWTIVRQNRSGEFVKWICCC